MTPQPSEQPTCDALGLCILPKDHDGKHETSFERVSTTPEYAQAAAPAPVASPEGAADALAQAMADSGYADPDPTDQWVLPDAAVIVRRLRERGYTVDPVASPAPLDVERLAEVLLVVHDQRTIRIGEFVSAQEAAEAIAADYEAEGQPAAEEPR